MDKFVKEDEEVSVKSDETISALRQALETGKIERGEWRNARPMGLQTDFQPLKEPVYKNVSPKVLEDFLKMSLGDIKSEYNISKD
jgi:hypothetical protein